jgi:flagellin
MALSILNNISSMTAENALSNTQASLQKTLTQLSTGLKINSGSDDAAGLSIAQGMTANIAALTQSQQNASNGIGMLQTADGALSQVNTLLNRAVTLATEGSTTGITSTQSTALDTEFQSILKEVNQIGQTTDFNGANVFSNNAPTTFTSTNGTAGAGALVIGNAYAPATAGTGTAMTAGSVTSITDGTGAFSFTAVAGDTVQNLVDAVNAAAKAGTLSSDTSAAVTGGKLVISSVSKGITAASSNDAALGSMSIGGSGASATSADAVTGGTSYVAASAGTGTALTAGSTTTIQDSATGGTFVFKAQAGDTLANLQSAITTAVSAGTLSANTAASINGSGELQITNGSTGINVTSNDAALGGMNALAGTNNTSTVYIGDGDTSGASNTEISTTIDALSATSLQLNSDNLNSTSSAQKALADVTAAINTISAQRGVIGASVNRLTAASSNMSNEVTNLQSASNSIQNADIGKTVANMTQYNVLQSTGMAALQQSNQAQQAVLKLVQ